MIGVGFLDVSGKNSLVCCCSVNQERIVGSGAFPCSEEVSLRKSYDHIFS